MSMYYVLTPAYSQKCTTRRPALKKACSDHTVDTSEGSIGNLCRQLEENNPDVDTVILGEPELTPLNAIHLCTSLGVNTKVNRIIIDFSYVKVFCGSVFGFVKYIESTKSLRSVVLMNVDMTDLKANSVLLVLLPGIAKNTCIKSFEMRSGETVYSNIFTALWYAITHAMYGGGATVNMLQTSVAHSLSNCQSIEDLVLACLPDKFNCHILPELAHFRDLTSLTFISGDHCSLDTLTAMASLVRSSLTLRTLQLENFQFNASNFTSLAESLVETMSVKELSLSNCSFKSISTQMLEDVATTMTKVTIGNDVKFSRSTSKVMASIVSQTEETSLKELDLADCPMSGKRVTRFAKEVQQNDPLVLECLSLPSASTPADIAAIKQLVLSMPNLKELRIAKVDADAENCKGLLDALKQTSNLMKCCLNGQEVVLNKPKEESYSFKLDRQNSNRRLKSLRKTLSSEEIKQITEKDAHIQHPIAPKEKAKVLPSDGEPDSPYVSHRERMMETMNRHRLRDRALELV